MFFDEDLTYNIDTGRSKSIHYFLVTQNLDILKTNNKKLLPDVLKDYIGNNNKNEEVCNA